MRKTIYAVLLVAAAASGAAVVVVTHKPDTPSLASKVVEPTLSYVAIGDSVAAGIGLDDPSDSSACDRTNQSYSHLVAKQLNVKITNYACSGAASNSGILASQVVNNLSLDPQLNQLFAAPERPVLVSLTIGANDIGWSKVIGKCYTATCGDSQDTNSIAEGIVTFSNNLSSILKDIQAHYSSNIPHVIATTYYQVFPATLLSCGSLAGITSEEINWWRAQQTNLNQAISNVTAAFPFSKVATPDFTGHELCSAEPWVQGIQDRAPYHPTAAGQQAIAKAVVAAQATF